MNKVIIGIVPTIKLNRNDNPFDDIYKFVDNYSSRIIEQGAIPIGLLLKEGNLDKDSLELCDAFIIPGGNRMHKIHYEVVDYALKNKKPILGICLGMQAITCYSRLKDIALKKDIEPTPDNLIELRKKLQEENIYMLESIEETDIHGKKLVNEEIEITKENILASTHKIKINSNTKLYNIINKEETNVISLHSFRIYECGNDFKVSATAEDGTIEAIEYINDDIWAVGLQFHPELENNNPIWKSFVEETIKRKNKI